MSKSRLERRIEKMITETKKRQFNNFLDRFDIFQLKRICLTYGLTPSSTKRKDAMKYCIRTQKLTRQQIWIGASPNNNTSLLRKGI